MPMQNEIQRNWAPVSALLLLFSLLLFFFFLYGLAAQIQIINVVDDGFLQLHSMGHALFRVFGVTAGVAGGTFLQLFVPFALGAFFFRKRQTFGFAVCIFFFFEQFLRVARYMADAQTQQLPWFSIGRYESSIHDWHYLFSELGVLSYAKGIAGTVHVLGSLGMVTVTAWLFWRGVNDIMFER